MVDRLPIGPKLCCSLSSTHNKICIFEESSGELATVAEYDLATANVDDKNNNVWIASVNSIESPLYVTIIVMDATEELLPEADPSPRTKKTKKGAVVKEQLKLKIRSRLIRYYFDQKEFKIIQTISFYESRAMSENERNKYTILFKDELLYVLKQTTSTVSIFRIIAADGLIIESAEEQKSNPLLHEIDLSTLLHLPTPSSSSSVDYNDFTLLGSYSIPSSILFHSFLVITIPKLSVFAFLGIRIDMTLNSFIEVVNVLQQKGRCAITASSFGESYTVLGYADGCVQLIANQHLLSLGFIAKHELEVTALYQLRNVASMSGEDVNSAVVISGARDGSLCVTSALPGYEPVIVDVLHLFQLPMSSLQSTNTEDDGFIALYGAERAAVCRLSNPGNESDANRLEVLLCVDLTTPVPSPLSLPIPPIPQTDLVRYGHFAYPANVMKEAMESSPALTLILLNATVLVSHLDQQTSYFSLPPASFEASNIPSIPLNTTRSNTGRKLASKGHARRFLVGLKDPMLMMS